MAAQSELAPLTRFSADALRVAESAEHAWQAYQPDYERAKRQNKQCLFCGTVCLMCPCAMYRLGVIAKRCVTRPIKKMCCCAPDFSVPPGPNTLRIAWTACNHQRNPTLCTSFAAIANSNPDIVIMAGDNIYIDLEPDQTMSIVSEKLAYRCMGSGVLYNEKLVPDWTYEQEYDTLLNKQNLAQVIQDRMSDKIVLATWDDHDFRGNYGQRKETKQQVKAHFVRFFEAIDFTGNIREQLGQEWDAIVHDPNRGIYYAYDYVKGSISSRIYVLDNRYDLTDDILGEEQWQWFEQKVIEARSNGISHHVIVNGTNVFTLKMFGVFPEETWTDAGRRRLWNILNGNGVVRQTTLLSGDIHMGVVNKKRDLYEFVAPSLTHSVLGFFAQCVECVGGMMGLAGNVCGCYGRDGPGCFWSGISNDNGYAVIDLENNHTRKFAIVGSNPAYNDVDVVVPLQCCG